MFERQMAGLDGNKGDESLSRGADLPTRPHPVRKETPIPTDLDGSSLADPSLFAADKASDRLRAQSQRKVDLTTTKVDRLSLTTSVGPASRQTKRDEEIDTEAPFASRNQSPTEDDYGQPEDVLPPLPPLPFPLASDLVDRETVKSVVSGGVEPQVTAVGLVDQETVKSVVSGGVEPSADEDRLVEQDTVRAAASVAQEVVGPVQSLADITTVGGSSDSGMQGAGPALVAPLPSVVADSIYVDATQSDEMGVGRQQNSILQADNVQAVDLRRLSNARSSGLVLQPSAEESFVARLLDRVRIRDLVGVAVLMVAVTWVVVTLSGRSGSPADVVASGDGPETTTLTTTSEATSTTALPGSTSQLVITGQSAPDGSSSSTRDQAVSTTATSLLTATTTSPTTTTTVSTTTTTIATTTTTTTTTTVPPTVPDGRLLLKSAVIEPGYTVVEGGNVTAVVWQWRDPNSVATARYTALYVNEQRVMSGGSTSPVSFDIADVRRKVNPVGEFCVAIVIHPTLETKASYAESEPVRSCVQVD